MTDPSTHSTVGEDRKRPITCAASPVTPPARSHSSFWAFLRTLFVGTAGLALLAVAGTIAGSAWLTANQRAEAEKPQPWADPSFTTTAVTTGGMLGRWMDTDGNLENGHSYIKGIYDIWKARQGNNNWSSIAADKNIRSRLPQLWQIEFNKDAELQSKAIAIEADMEKNELERKLREIRNKVLAAPL